MHTNTKLKRLKRWGVCLNTPMNDTYIQHTTHWLSNVIIEKEICPFAKREFDQQRIHFEVIESADVQQQLEQLIIQCEALDEDSHRETSLLIFPHGLSDFEDYLDFLEIATELLIKQAYEGIYQLASFHPLYRFDGAAIDDASNYTNRSPYPMLHILREESVEKALAHYPDPENIPQRNIEMTRELGLSTMKKLLADCYS